VQVFGEPFKGELDTRTGSAGHQAARRERRQFAGLLSSAAAGRTAAPGRLRSLLVPIAALETRCSGARAEQLTLT